MAEISCLTTEMGRGKIKRNETNETLVRRVLFLGVKSELPTAYLANLAALA